MEPGADIAGKRLELPQTADRKAAIGRAEWNRRVAEVFQPLMRGFLLPAAIYYLIVVAMHYVTETPRDFAILGGIAVITSAVLFLFHRRLQTPGASYHRLEIYALVSYALIYANILALHLLHLEVHKLVYFLMLTQGVAGTGISMRLIVPVTLVSLATSIWLASTGGPEVQSQFAFIALAGSFVAFSTAGLMRIAIHREIRARLKAEELLTEAEFAAEHDALTLLPNRRQFFRRLDEVYAKAGEGSHLALGIVDLNGFKPINDLYGHAFGDQLLADVGRRIKDVCGETMLVARMGGDEFTILIESPTSEYALNLLGSEICAAVGQTYNITGTQIVVSAAVGFARRMATTTDATHLYEHADYALYRAKECGHGAVEVFSAEDESVLQSIKKVERYLRDSDWDAEMSVDFQPQVDITTMQVTGFEALARWQSAALGRVSPDMFIRAAERCGIIGEITPLLLRKALAEAANWPEDIRLSFNLSARDVVAAASIEQICAIVETSDFPGERIDFEITETSIMTDFGRVRSSLRRLQQLGSKIALDDFGVGYSNFEHIDELNIHKLKIDRRFVSRLGTGDNTGRIVRTMIEMCANLGLKCIIEGVETQVELDAVRKAGGNIVQGYYFSRPLLAADVLPFLDEKLSDRAPRRRARVRA